MKTSFPSYTTESVLSADGTVIGYRRFGAGPGIVLLHGGLQAAQNFTRLAELLSEDFTVFVPDRRGRGLSGPRGDCYGIAREREDVAALVEKTGARCLFGLSSGGVVALYAALEIPTVRKIALYEPPLSTRGSTPTRWGKRYDREIAAGKPGAAFVTIMKGLRVSPLFAFLPRFLTVPLMSLALRNAVTKDGDVPIAALIPTMRSDLRLILETSDALGSFKALPAETLLLGGSKSPAYLLRALEALRIALPRVRKVVFKGLDHLGPDDTGNPERVARELRAFFT